MPNGKCVGMVTGSEPLSFAMSWCTSRCIHIKVVINEDDRLGMLKTLSYP